MYRRDLYGVSFLPYLSRSWAAAAMRWACHSWSWWRLVARSARRWASRSHASSVLGRSRVASSPPRGPDVTDELLEGEVWWCCRVVGVTLHATCLCRPAHGGGECPCIRAAQDGV